MKLKKLIVSGFKSFADRTEFDFDDGVSCVVGPNGCGKSNVVDAIKWVLGEQSAKSLRGSEMMDVIFNGSSSRRPGSMAEVTLVFDNSDGLLKPTADSTEITATVAVSRRLFRNGNSEYLINKAPSRLRDIREMFMDTGIGTDAYSIIEQGRVEGFLQATQEDRRSIFDEAAGISKYKARRKEALRKLERVDQNLLRLTDIVAEVDKRLRSIKHQAGKARNYQSYSERLKELRSLHLLAQYHTLSGQRGALRTKLDASNDHFNQVSAQIEQLEAARSATEVEGSDLERTARDLQGRIGAIGGMINAAVQRAEMLEARVKELTEQIQSAGGRCDELAGKIEQCTGEITSRAGQLEQLDAQVEDLSGRYESMRQEHTAGELALTKLAASLEDEKAGTIDLLRRTAQLHNEIHGLGIRRENLTGQKGRLATRADEIEGTLAGMLTQRAEIAARLVDVRELLKATQARHEETRQARGKVISSEQALGNQLSQAREKRSGVLSRMGALKEMQQRLEGVGAGVRRVLKAKAEGKLTAIAGMLGDAIETDTRHAPLVEAALAGADQQLLADSFEQVQSQANQIAAALGDNCGVEILCLDRLGVLSSDFDLAGAFRTVEAGTGSASASEAEMEQVTSSAVPFSRIIDFVKTEASFAPLLWRLLGRTLIVNDLNQAAQAAAMTPAGYRFVTLAGEVLEADGRVRLGSGNRGSGVITRRSELAELAVQQKQLEDRIARLDEQCKSTRVERQHLEELDQSLRQAIYEANTERVECEARHNQFDEQVAKLQREQPLITRDIQRLAEEIEASVQSEHNARAKVAELDDLNNQRQNQIARLTEQINTARSRQGDMTAQLTELKVSLASAQQRKLSLKEAQNALLRQREALQTDLQSVQSQTELNRQRVEDAARTITSSRSEAAKLTEQRQTLAAEAQDVEESRRGLQEKLDQIRTQLTGTRKAAEAAASAVNDCKIELGEVDVRIENLIARANEEMGMNLLEHIQQYQHDDQRDWSAVEVEINDLRSKIERLGNVNLDAIAEQEELENRGKFLTEQLADVRGSQQQLAELIKRINKESQEMFMRTFETVRTNFQDLFRKLFGGGKADILLENPEDVLETSIEIVARPPGKELRSLSLLSGGEKTMTALALLFSIFRSRPSPFCLLDEVDAALDEANNRRFTTLVQEFVSDSQFIIISHSKRTMSMANVLYGVTMQEPGVSKRISVKFEEVSAKPDGELQFQNN